MTARSSRAPFALVASCLFLSGAGSLVLEVVWSRLLKLVFGSSTLAIATILVAYMLGLGLGGLLGGRFAARFKNGIRVYAYMELAIAAYALAVPFLLDLYPAVNRLLFANLGFWPAAAGRFALALAALILPTILMGATLPFLVQAVVKRNEELAKGTGLLYGINTLGAVAGVLTATFVLFPAVGVGMTNLIGAGADAAVGLVALFFVAPLLGRVDETSAQGPEGRASAEPVKAAAPSGSLPRWNLALVSYGIVGFTALTYEVAWTRALTMVCGSSVYAFATMLAAFLCGIALGSLVGRYFFDRLKRPLFVYAMGMAALGVASLVTFFAFRALPDIFLNLFATIGVSSRSLVLSTLILSFGAMAAPTILLGALFPLLTRGLATSDRPASRTVGDVYFVNTIGSAAGAFCAGFLLIPLIGLKWTLISAAVTNLLAGTALLLWQRQRAGTLRNVVALGTAGAAVALVVAPPEWRADKLASGVFLNPDLVYRIGLEDEPLRGMTQEQILFYEEGVNTTTSVHLTNGNINLRVNGKADASTRDMATQVVSGHMAPLLHGRPDDVLVIGLASGVTAGTVALYEPRRLDIAEIEPAIIDASRYFDDLNHRPLEYAGTSLILDDARTYLTYADRTYDLIISEPSNPWITGCSNLFTTDFIRQVKQQLNEGGVLVQWIQTYGLDPLGIQSILSAVKEEFGYVYGITSAASFGDLLLLASDEPMDLDRIPEWDDIDPRIRRDLQWTRVYSRADLLALVSLSNEDTDRLVSGALHENSDDSMFVELRAPWYLYEGTDENSRFLFSESRGILPIVEKSSSAGDPELLGAIAKAYHGLRELPLHGDRALEAIEGESASALVTRAELEARREGADPGQVFAMLDRAVRLAPDACLPRLYRGQRFFDAGNPYAAIADLDVAANVCGGDPRVTWGRIRVLLQLGRVPEAYELAKQLVEEPLSMLAARAYPDVALTAARAGELEQAIEWMMVYLAQRPQSPREWEFVAKAHDALGQDALAADARANIELARKNLVRREHRTALKKFNEGEPELALPRMEWVAERDPENPRVRKDLEKMRAAAKGASP